MNGAYPIDSEIALVHNLKSKIGFIYLPHSPIKMWKTRISDVNVIELEFCKGIPKWRSCTLFYMIYSKQSVWRSNFILTQRKTVLHFEWNNCQLLFRLCIAMSDKPHFWTSSAKKKLLFKRFYHFVVLSAYTPLLCYLAGKRAHSS